MVHGLRAFCTPSSIGMSALVSLPHITLNLRDDAPNFTQRTLMHQNFSQKLSGHRNAVSGKKTPAKPLFLPQTCPSSHVPRPPLPKGDGKISPTAFSSLQQFLLNVRHEPQHRVISPLHGKLYRSNPGIVGMIVVCSLFDHENR